MDTGAEVMDNFFLVFFLFLSFCGCAISLGNTEIYETPKRKCSLFVIHFYKGHEFRRGSMSLEIFSNRPGPGTCVRSPFASAMARRS